MPNKQLYLYCEDTDLLKQIARSDQVGVNPVNITITKESNVPKVIPKEYLDLDTIYASINDIKECIYDMPEIPSFTSDDNGKILGVVNGQLIWTNIGNAEGGSY